MHVLKRISTYSQGHPGWAANALAVAIIAVFCLWTSRGCEAW